MTDTDHWHLIAVQDYRTDREWWTIRTNQYDRGEAAQQARQLLAERPDGHGDGHGDGNDQWGDHAETGDDHPEPVWSAIWLTSCSEPCTWAAAPPSYTWTLPPPGDPWWTADGILPRSPARTASVALTTVQTATWAELKQMGLSDDDLKLLGITDADLADLSDRPRKADLSDRPH